MYENTYPPPPPPIHTPSSLALCTLCFLFLFSIACTPAIINDEAQQVASLIQNSNPDSTYNVLVNRDDPDAPFIVIDGITNTAESPLSFTIAINQDEGITTNTQNIEVMAPTSISPYTKTITVSATFGSADPVDLKVEIRINGAAVEEWLTPTNFSNYFTAVTFAGQTGSLSFDGNSIAIDGTSDAAITNVPNGDIVLTTNLPPGYSITGHDALTDPDGLRLAEITNGDAGSIIISEDENPIANKKTYPVRINLAAYRSPVEASHISAIFNENAANPSNIEIRGTDIIIKGFPNITGDSIDAGSIDITPSPAYTVDTSSFKFDNPEGTDAQEITVGTVNVTLSAGSAVTHTIKVSLSRYYQLIIRSQHVVDNPFTIESGDTVRLMNLGACDILPAPDIDIVGITSASVSGFPRYFDRRIDIPTEDTPPVYQANRVLRLEDGNKNILDETFSVTVVGFPDCDASALTGTGTSNDAYIIDSATKLELLSHLVATEYAAYTNEYYSVTNDINLGLAELPWSETTSGETGEGFIPIGNSTIKAFYGDFNCNNNTISNLYIRKGGTAGLFGTIGGSSISNCRLENVKVSGGNNVGGLVGISIYAITISNIYVSGTISGNNDVGGVVGFVNDHGSQFINLHTNVLVSGNLSVGGLVGYVVGSITNSYFTGSVKGHDLIGGIGGYFRGQSITNSYVIGSVSGNNHVGGLVGNAKNASIVNSYVSGSVSGTNPNNTYIGLFIGSNGIIDNSVLTPSYTGVTDSYFNNEAVLSLVTVNPNTGDITTTTRLEAKGVGSDDTSDPATTTASLTGLSTSELQVEQGMSGSTDPYISWDATEWQFSNDQYPRLINVACASRQYSQDQNIACASL